MTLSRLMGRGVIAASAILAVGLLFMTPTAARVVCYLKGEYLSGMSKICLYNCGWGEAHITVAATKLCPLSIER